MMTAAILVIALAVQAPASPQQIQELFEAGQHQQVVDAAQGRTEPRVIYLAGLAHLSLQQQDAARQKFDSLTTRGDQDAWTHIGRSATLLNGPAPTPEAAGQAEQAARRAIELDPALGIAHYQLGLVHGRRDDYAAAATAFDAASAADPRFAYAHYYGGLSHYQNQQTTQMAIAFENFLKVAPNAPERGQVESIMRTLRGR